MAGRGATAGPCFGFLEINAQRPCDRQGGLVHIAGRGFGRASGIVGVSHALVPLLSLTFLKMRFTVFRSLPRGGSNAIFPFFSMAGNFSVSFINLPVPSL